MRNNNQHHVASTSTFGGVEQKMTLDQNSLAHLMTVLTDLYSDPMLAVIREYSTNALDSHLAAGNPQPIVVNLPNDLNPSFEVTDHGVGLSVDDIVNVYSKYGYSTKRDNDVEAGMLGLGCKSALTYTDQFTVTAVKDGVRALAVVSRAEDGTGTIRIVDTSSTVEKNGVTISVPVSDIREFNNTARDFYRFWSPGTVLVDGEEPALDGIRVSDDLTIAEGLNSSYVVMGNIAYPVEQYKVNLAESLPYRMRVVIRVPMGAVNFTPSREALNYTALTYGTLRKLKDEVRALTTAAAQRDINAATTEPEVMDAIIKWWGIAAGPFTFKGQNVPMQFTDKDGIIDYNPTRYRKKAERTGSVDIRTMRDEKTCLIDGFKPSTLSPVHRKKLAAYCEENDIDATRFFVTEQPLGLPWTQNVERIDWEDVKAIKLVHSASGVRKVSDPEPIAAWDGQDWVELENTDEGDKVLVISPADRGSITPTGLIAALPGYRCVCIGRNRWDKFFRERPKARKARDVVIDLIAEFDKNLTDADLIALNSYNINIPPRLDPDKIDDPVLADAVRTYRASRTSTAPRQRELLVRVANNLGRYQGIPQKPGSGKVKSMTEAVDKYPLLRYAGTVDVRHLHEYINAVHTTRENN